MIPAFCPAERRTEPLERSLRATDVGKVRVLNRWIPFTRLAPEAECAVVALPGPAPRRVARLGEWKRRHDPVPVVLAVTKKAAVARQLARLAVEELVWIRTTVPELAAAVRRARTQGFMENTARELRETGLPASLRDALVTAVLQVPPFPTVSALSRSVERDRRTLWGHWRRAAGDRTPLTLKNVLDLILLVRAVGMKVDGTTWNSIAASLQVGERALRRVSKQHLHRLPRQVSSGDLARVRARFRAKVVEPLTGCPHDPPGEMATDPEG